jgi:hypothetical protein
MNFTLRFTLAVCMLAISPAGSAQLGIKPDGHLDMPVLRRAYMESEFEKVRGTLETFLKKAPQDATRDEKVFTHMYLGVIYAADSAAEVRAESHFNALLQLSPHIEPVDMFVPPKIQDLFDRIKRDYLKRQEYTSRYDSFGNPISPEGDSTHTDPVPKDPTATGPSGKNPVGNPPAKTPPAVSAGSSHAWVWWTLGSAAAVAAGVSLYTLTGSTETSAPHRTTVDGKLP